MKNVQLFQQGIGHMPLKGNRNIITNNISYFESTVFHNGGTIHESFNVSQIVSHIVNPNRDNSYLAISTAKSTVLPMGAHIQFSNS